MDDRSGPRSDAGADATRRRIAEVRRHARRPARRRRAGARGDPPAARSRARTGCPSARASPASAAPTWRCSPARPRCTSRRSRRTPVRPRPRDRRRDRRRPAPRRARRRPARARLRRARPRAACPECAQGLPALCRNTTDGDVSAGLQTGFCRDTGGGWSEGLVAHTSAAAHRARRPLRRGRRARRAARLRAARRARSPTSSRARTSRSSAPGTIGLLTLAAVRERAPSATLICVAKHAGQQTAARRFGADDVCAPDRLYIEGARITGIRAGWSAMATASCCLAASTVYLTAWAPERASSRRITITRPRGRVVLVGMPGELKADLAAAWLRELELRGAYGYEHDFPARARVRQDAQARPPDRPRLAAARVQEGARARARRPRARAASRPSSRSPHEHRARPA